MRFGGVQALTDVSISVNPGEILGVIGPNGAGKTTLFSILSGFLRPTRGSLFYSGSNIAELAPHERSRLGLIRTWQIPRPFATMTVRENVVVAAIAGGGTLEGADAKVDEILRALELHAHSNESAADLAPGHRKRLELARALVRNPRLLLLDEVMAGQTPGEADALFHVLKHRVRTDGLTIVMIEHVIRAVRALCDRVVVLAAGKVLSEGVPDDVMSRPEVIQAYIGASDRTSRPVTSNE